MTRRATTAKVSNLSSPDPGCNLFATLSKNSPLNGTRKKSKSEIGELSLGNKAPLAFLGARVTYTKVVALAMQMLDRKPSDEPVLTVEEEAVDYEA